MIPASPPMVIIGSGLAGYLFAKEFRQLNKTTPLQIITESDGRFYSKPLLSTALTQKKTAAELSLVNAAEMAMQLNAVIRANTRVESIDPATQTITIAGTQEILPYSQLILACGSHPVTPALMGNAVHTVQAVNDLQAYTIYRDWLADKQSLVIIGAGLVGCEFTNDLINAGYHVTVVSKDAYPLAKFVPAPIGHAFAAALAEKGVQWYLGYMATEVNYGKQDIAVTVSDEKTQQEIITDGVFAAVGIRAALELAKTAGIQTRRGVVVDRYLQTNHKNIYALGDCAEVDGELRQYVAPLMHCVRVLAQHLNGGDGRVTYPAMPIIVKTPACPLVIAPVPSDLAGEWEYEIINYNGKALFYDELKRLRGFVLMGASVRERVALTSQLSL